MGINRPNRPQHAMNVSSDTPMRLDPGAALAAALHHAPGLTARAGVLIFPTETVWAIATRSDAFALTRLQAARTLLGDANTGPATWHVGSVDAILRVAGGPGVLTPIQRRAVQRLCPGPVTLRLELAPEHLEGVLSSAGLEPGLANEGATLNIRAVAHAGAGALLLGLGGLVAIGTGDGPRAFRTMIAARHQLGHGPIELFEADALPSGRFSTVVRLPRRGGFFIDRVGAVSAQQVESRVCLRVLMVCTGNTCRSPMAEAIARAQVEHLAPGSVPVRISSAGINTAGGEPMSGQAIAALAELGVPLAPRGGVGARAGLSHPLTPEALDGAQVIFAMTSEHLRQIERLDPAAAARATLLDPSGDDVPDPFGSEVASYLRTARAISSMIAARLTQLTAGELGSAGIPARNDGYFQGAIANGANG